MDYADYLTPERVRREERAWARSQDYKRYATAVGQVIGAMPPDARQVIELGCGTGWVPYWLQVGLGVGEEVQYDGIDRQPECLRLARVRNQSFATRVRFHDRELRHFQPPPDALVCAFAVLKHFRLDEWEALFVQWFGEARYAVFSVPIADTPHDDGTEFTHTWQSKATVQQALDRAGLRVLWWDDENAVEPIITAVRR